LIHPEIRTKDWFYPQQGFPKPNFTKIQGKICKLGLHLLFITNSVQKKVFKNKVLMLFLLFFALYNLTYQQNTFALPLQFSHLFGDSLGAKRFGLLMTVNALTVLVTTPFITTKQLT